MHEGVLHMAARVGTRFRNERHATTAHSFDADKAETLFNAGQDEQIALAHQFGNIFAMAQDLDAGMRQHAGHFFSVCRKHAAGD